MGSNNTIFDDVFLTLLEKLPHLVIPLINEVFHTDYTEEDEVTQLREAHQTQEGRRTTDSTLRIRDKWYHIECQSNPDSTIIIRMIEYDFSIALEHVKKINKKYVLEFPRSCILYLRHTKHTKEAEEVEVHFPDGSRFRYKVPIIKVQEYTKDKLFQKKLLFLLPFYIMRYEKEKKRIENDAAKLNALLAEYQDIRNRLEISFGKTDQSKELLDLKELIARIADYIFRNESRTKKGVQGIMRGKVLELESDRIYAAGISAGRTEGLIEGRIEGRIEAYIENGYSLEHISKKVDIPVEKVKEILAKLSLTAPDA